MPELYGGEIQDDDRAYVNGLDRAQVPFMDALGASARDAWVHNPVAEIGAVGDLNAAENPEERYGPRTFARMMEDPEQRKAFEYLDPKDLNAKYSQSLGLTFDRPMRAGAVDIMVRRKEEELQRNAYLSRAPDTTGFAIANFATQLAVSATDPLNIASAFIPVIGEARYGLWAERYGRTAARFARGGIEGAVGATLVEPIVYGAEQAYQGDYDLMDSFMNVTVGTVLGGGLHAGFGAISDRLNRADFSTRESALRAAVANIAEGRAVEVDHVIATDPKFFDRLPVIDQTEFRLTAEEARLRSESDAVGQRIQSLPAPDTQAQDALARLDAVEAQLKDENIDPALRRELSARRDELLADTTPEQLRERVRPIEERRNLENQRSSLESQIKATNEARTSHAVENVLGPIRQAVEAGSRENPRFAELLRQQHEAPQAFIDRAREIQQGETPAIRQAADRALDRARTRTEAFGRNEEPSTATSPEASEAAERIVKEKTGDDIAAEYTDALRVIDEMEKQGALTPQEAEAARSGKDDLALASRDSKAAAAAARCLLLHP